MQDQAERCHIPAGRPPGERERLGREDRLLGDERRQRTHLRHRGLVDELGDERADVASVEDDADDRADLDPTEHPFGDRVVELAVERSDR
jgi:hypothetical protein